MLALGLSHSVLSSCLKRTGQKQNFATKCPNCKKPVLAHTQGNGDFVYLDLPIGPEWEVHECYALLLETGKSSPRAAQKPAPAFVGSYTRNGNRVDLRGRISEIRERGMFQRLRGVPPQVRQNATEFLKNRTTELVVVVEARVQYPVYADVRNTVLGSGSVVRMVATRTDIPGLGRLLACETVEVLKRVPVSVMRLNPSALSPTGKRPCPYCKKKVKHFQQHVAKCPEHFRQVRAKEQARRKAVQKPTLAPSARRGRKAK
ncbi:MAG TPA: hypothetical protein VGQ49_15230 [Bryobacteraceae bacterium]|jgi:hypothetical protein|nr:hypothetical protein [Bryobacteraceae bacterium]